MVLCAAAAAIRKHYRLGAAKTYAILEDEVAGDIARLSPAASAVRAPAPAVGGSGDLRIHHAGIDGHAAVCDLPSCRHQSKQSVARVLLGTLQAHARKSSAPALIDGPSRPVGCTEPAISTDLADATSPRSMPPVLLSSRVIDTLGELLRSEVAYVKVMTSVCNEMLRLRQTGVISQRDVGAIFGDIETIRSVNEVAETL